MSQSKNIARGVTNTHCRRKRGKKKNICTMVLLLPRLTIDVTGSIEIDGPVDNVIDFWFDDVAAPKYL